MYRLSDDVISEVAKLVQLAILTGTDIVDNLRMIRVEDNKLNNGSLSLTSDYREHSESQVEKLLSELNEASEREEHNKTGE